MMSADDLTQEMLDLLYGLLDGPEADAARAKAQTPEGRAAMQRAEACRALMAKAAKLEFTETRFAAPTTLPTPAPAKSFAWRRLGWLVAAAVLVAVSVPNAIEYARVRQALGEAQIAEANAKETRALFEQST